MKTKTQRQTLSSILQGIQDYVKQYAAKCRYTYKQMLEI